MLAAARSTIALQSRVFVVFENITQSLGKAFSAFRGTGKITESNIRDGMQQVRKALLEADVAYDVVQSFVQQVTEEAIGERVLKSLRPEEQIVGIVHQQLINLMGPVDHSLAIKRDGVSIIMMSAHLAASVTSITLNFAASAFLAEADPLRSAITTFLTPLSRRFCAWAWPWLP